MRRIPYGTWMAVVMGAALVAGACGGGAEHDEKGEADDDSITTPSATGTNPAPTPAPTATPTPAPAATPTPAAAPTPTATIAYVQDIKPILDANCVRCHSGMATYKGTLGYVRPGDSSSPLVTATQPGGSMYGHLGGDPAARAALIQRWVVDNRAAETR
jgi:hypothetical protein